MCQVGHNITSGWSFDPCTCEGWKAKHEEYRRVRVPELLKLADELERRAEAWERKLSIS